MSNNEPERLAKIWGLNVADIQQAWDCIVLGKERQNKGKLNRAESLVFLFHALRNPEIEYLTASLADNLCYRKFGQKGPHPATFYRHLDFLVEKMPDEIVVDKVTNSLEIHLSAILSRA